MMKNKEEETDIDIPSGDDENVGDGSSIKKREKRRKSKEERIAERKVIFWTLLIIVAITFGFWFVPRVRSIINGEPISTGQDKEKDNKSKIDVKNKQDNNYVEITL